MSATKKRPARRNRVALHVLIAPALAEALGGYLSSAEPRVTRTAAVESALREFLKARGQWPAEGEGDR